MSVKEERDSTLKAESRDPYFFEVSSLSYLTLISPQIFLCVSLAPNTNQKTWSKNLEVNLDLPNSRI